MQQGRHRTSRTRNRLLAPASDLFRHRTQHGQILPAESPVEPEGELLPAAHLHPFLLELCSLLRRPGPVAFVGEAEQETQEDRHQHSP